jgi:outer membrane immunogenic protein
VLAGGQVGYNWQGFSNWILGFEADFQGTGEKAKGNNHEAEQDIVTATNMALFATTSVSQSISRDDSLIWFGTARGRIGYAIWPTVMLYGTGGLAYGRLKDQVSASLNGFCTTNDVSCTGSITFLNGPTRTVPFSVSQGFEANVTRTGWTVGGGIEGVVPDAHITLKVEYLYMDLGTANYTFNNPLLGTILVSSHFTDNIVRVGANYQFH